MRLSRTGFEFLRPATPSSAGKVALIASLFSILVKPFLGGSFFIFLFFIE
jgi:hypothetical protein